jgi:uracil-DNA glycosylase
MVARNDFPGAARFLPTEPTLAALRQAATDCRGCDLFRQATQTVFGAGSPRADLVMVGEQPGDVEDVEGTPFVGPAGRLLDRAMAEAGIDRAAVYLTNAVKHFRWKPARQGSRRIHEKPATSHIAACRPWLAAELDSLSPRVVVALGATAAQALFGRGFRLTEHRGEVLPWPANEGAFADGSTIEAALATIHPSAVLRADGANRQQMYQGLVDDLRSAQGEVDHSARSAPD